MLFRWRAAARHGRLMVRPQRSRRRGAPAWASVALLLLAIVMLCEPAAVSAKAKKSAKPKKAPAFASPCETRPPQLLWTQGVDRQPMALDAFPRPRNDTGRGIHWAPTTHQTPDEVDRLLAAAQTMHISWITFLNKDVAIGPNDYLVKQAMTRDIEPIMRVYTPHGQPIAGTPDELAAMVRHYRQLGVRYFQLYNEPNNKIENPDGRPDVERYVTQWSDAARVVIMNGGLPGIGALSPGGDVDDLQFLDQTLESLVSRGQLHLLDCAWFSLHNYSFNRPIDYVGDQHSYLSFRLYDALIRQRLGRSLPMIGTEGGTRIGVAFDPAYPPVGPDRHVQLVLDAYRYLNRPEREPYYFAFSYWLIADERMANSVAILGPPPLYRPISIVPLFDRIAGLPTRLPASEAPGKPATAKTSKIIPSAPAPPNWLLGAAPLPGRPGPNAGAWRALPR
jgi:hypothetical protein